MLKKLFENRASVHQKMEELRGKADANTGAFTAEQQADYDRLGGEFDTLTASIAREQAAQKRAQSLGGRTNWADEPGAKDAPPGSGAPATYSDAELREHAKLRGQYRFLDAVSRAASGRPLEGLYAEMAKEAASEARAQGIALQDGGIHIPSFIIADLAERRDLTVGTNTAGGFTVQTDLGQLIPILQPRLVTKNMGANYLPGLQGNVAFPRNNGDATAGWVGETGDSSAGEPTFDQFTMSPKRLACHAVLSKTLINQSNFGIESFVRERINFAVARALDEAAIRGTGASNQPTGLFKGTFSTDKYVVTEGLVPSATNVLAIGTNGGAPTWTNVVGLETIVSDANADIQNMGYLASPALAGKMKVVEKASNTGMFLWQGPNLRGEVNGYNAMVSTLVPKILEKGSSKVCSALIFGNWREMFIGNWGGLDVVVDPYTLAGKASIKLVVNSWWDINVAHGQSFAMVLDATY